MVAHGKHSSGDTVYTVTYDSSSEIGVLFQMWGSVWPKALPYCLLNLAIAVLVQYLYDKRGLDMSISGTSHGFMSTMIGFLLVTRVSMAYQRYLDLRGCLESMTRQTREMVQNMVLLTGPFQTTSDKEWRRETAAKTLVLLRAVMAVVDYGSERVPAWDVGGLTPTQRKDLLADLFQQSGPHCREKRWSRPPRTEMEESMRVPTILAQQLRACLGAGETRLSGKPDAYRFFNLYGAVDGFMESYYSLRRHMTTPFPFPMEQMNRTFLYFYIFTVPLTLLQDVSDDYPYMQLLVTVFLTYGFVGLQLIAIELDDPFGNDQNDFNNIAMAQDTCDDVYMMICNCDGREYADQLGAEMLPARRQPNDFNDASLLAAGGGETTPLIGGPTA